MSSVLGGGSQAQSKAQVYTIRIQGAAYGAVIPLLYGTQRMAPNVIWFGDVTAYEQKSAAGGKGGGETSTEYWKASFESSVSQGPVTGFGQAWYMGQTTEVASPAAVAAAYALFDGAFGQAAWAYMVSNHPGMDLGYTGIAYLAKSQLQLGTSPSLPQFNYEVIGQLPFDYPTIVDAEPGALLIDFLTNVKYGAGFPSAYIDTATWAAYSQFNTARGLFLSPNFNQQRSAADWLKEILEITLSDVTWVDGVLKIYPYYDVAVTGNGATYTPNFTPVIASSDDDQYLIESEDQPDDPIIVERIEPADRYNAVSIEMTSRANAYKQQVQVADSQADIALYQLRPAQPKHYPEICLDGVGKLVATLQLVRSLNVMNTYKFKLPGRYIYLRPLDIWPLTDANLGLSNYNVRVVDVTLNENEQLEVEAEDVGVCNSPDFAGGGGGGGSAPVGPPSINPTINAPLIFEPTASMLPPYYLELWLALSGDPAATWGGCTVWYSEDDSTYNVLQNSLNAAGQQTASAVMGFLTATLASSTAQPDTTDTLEIDLSESDGDVTSISAALAGNAPFYNLAVMCGPAPGYANPEVITFENVAAGSGPNQFNLTDLWRALFNTGGHARSIGDSFAYLGNVSNIDPGIFRWLYPKRLVGRTVWFKLTSIDSTLSEEEQLSIATAYPYTIKGTAVNPGPTGTGPRMFIGTGPATGFAYIASDTIWYPTPALRGQCGLLCLAPGVDVGATWAEFGYIDALDATEGAPPAAQAVWDVVTGPVPTSAAVINSPPSATIFTTLALRGSIGAVDILSGAPGAYRNFGIIAPVTITPIAVAGPLATLPVVVGSDVPVGTYTAPTLLVYTNACQTVGGHVKYLGKICLSGGTVTSSSNTSTWAECLPGIV